jgi:hypothetical protein
MTSSLHLSRQVEPKSLIPRGIAQITHCWRHDQAQDPDVTIAQRHSRRLLRQIAAKDLRQITSKATPKRYPSSWEYSNNPQTSTKWTSLTPIVSSAVAVETVSTVASLIRAANLTSDRMDCNIRSAGIATLKRIVLISRAVDTPTEALALLIANSASPASSRPLRSSSSVGTAISSAVGHGAW